MQPLLIRPCPVRFIPLFGGACQAHELDPEFTPAVRTMPLLSAMDSIYKSQERYNSRPSTLRAIHIRYWLSYTWRFEIFSLSVFLS